MPWTRKLFKMSAAPSERKRRETSKRRRRSRRHSHSSRHQRRNMRSHRKPSKRRVSSRRTKRAESDSYGTESYSSFTSYFTDLSTETPDEDVYRRRAVHRFRSGTGYPETDSVTTVVRGAIKKPLDDKPPKPGPKRNDGTTPKDKKNKRLNMIPLPNPKQALHKKKSYEVNKERDHSYDLSEVRKMMRSEINKRNGDRGPMSLSEKLDRMLIQKSLPRRGLCKISACLFAFGVLDILVQTVLSVISVAVLTKNEDWREYVFLVTNCGKGSVYCMVGYGGMRIARWDQRRVMVIRVFAIGIAALVVAATFFFFAIIILIDFSVKKVRIEAAVIWVPIMNIMFNLIVISLLVYIIHYSGKALSFNQAHVHEVVGAAAKKSIGRNEESNPRRSTPVPFQKMEKKKVGRKQHLYEND